MKTTTITATIATAAAISGFQAFSPSGFCADAPAPAPARPNIFVFLTDDMSWTTTSIGVCPDFPTPNIKRVAATGMTFDRAYVASPSCAPSRAALLTSMYPVRNGSMYNHQYPTLVQKKWPDYFHDLGYEVVAIGKVAHYFQVTRYNFDYSAHYTYHDDVCVDEAIKWLKARQADPKRSKKPICFMVGTNWPHVPWPTEGAPKWPKENAQNVVTAKNATLLPQLLDTPETRKAWHNYAAAVTNADNDLGKTYDAVMKYLGKDTIVVFSADNGMQFPFHKWNCYNGGLHEPFVVSWPGKVAAGVHTQALVSWIDVLPTLMEAAGATPPATGLAKGQIDGISFLPVLLGQTDKARDIIYGTHSGDGSKNESPMRAVIGPRYKYIRNLAPDRVYHTHVDLAPGDTGYWPSWAKLAKTDAHAAEVVNHYFHRPPEEFYDIEKDPFDLTNLINDPAVANIIADYRAKCDAQMAAYGDKGLPTEVLFRKKFDEDAPNNAAANHEKGAKKGGKKGGKAAQSDDE